MTNDITLTDVINQMQVHAGEFRKEFRKVHTHIKKLSTRVDSLDKRIDNVEKTLTTQINGIDQKLIWQRTALTNIDKRLNDIELEFLPKRVSRIEQKLQLQS